MIGYRPRLSSFLEYLFPWLMLAVLLLFTYAFFFAVPYAGFRYRANGQVVELFSAPAPQADLQIGDQLVQVGAVQWSDFSRNQRLVLFEGVQARDEVPLVVEREGRRLTSPWVFPGFTSNEFAQRLNSEWFLTYFFWLAGTIVLISVRPKDGRRRLLIVFYYVTALWLVIGSGVASPIFGNL